MLAFLVGRLAAAMSGLLLGLAALPAQCGTQWLPGDGFPGVAGTRIQAMIWWDPDGGGPIPNRLVIAGSFAAAFTIDADNIAAWDPVADTWSSLGGGVDDRVQALAVMPNGDLIAGGEFAWAGGQPAKAVARFDGSSWSAVGGSMGGYQPEVYGLAVMPNGDLVAGGSFSVAGGVACEKIARFDGSSWSPLAAGVPGQYTSVGRLLGLGNGDLLAAGNLDSTPGPMRYLRRWDGTAWSAVGGGLDNYVADMLEQPNGDVVVCGSFTSAGSTPANRIARWDGSTWSPLGAGLGASHAISLTRLTNGDLLVGGSFTAAGGAPARNAAIWNGATWNALGAGPDLLAYDATELPDGRLLVVGYEINYPTLHAFAWDGTSWSRPGSGFRGYIEDLVALQSGGAVAGGTFTQAGDVLANRIARFDGTSWSPLGAGMDDTVSDVTELPDGSIVAAGEFTTAGSVAANRIARWDGAVWSPLGQGLNDTVTDLITAQNGDPIAVGHFISAGGSFVPFVARWDGTSWSGFGGYPNWYVEAIVELPNGDLVIGGGFTTVGGIACQRIAYWDGSSWSPLGPGLPGWVRELHVMPDGDIVAAYDGGISRWDGTSWAPFSIGWGTTNVNAMLTLPNGDVLAATGLGAQNLSLARWDGTGWSPVAGGIDGGVNAIAFDGRSTLYVGGNFRHAGGQVSVNFARLAAVCPATAAPIATACAGTNGPVTLSADSMPWVGSTFTSTAHGFAPGSLAVAIVGLTSPATPLSSLWPNTTPACTQLASPEAIALLVAPGTTAGYSLVIPNDPTFAGMSLFHQFLQFEVDVQNQLAALSGSNGLQLTIGVF